jgi:GxxExxY protein
MQQGDQEFRRNDLTGRVIGACITVHRALGPGLLESAYEQCLCRELELLKVPFRRQVPIRIDYKGALVDCAYRVDLVVDGQLAIELKSVDQIDTIHLAQVLTYLKLGRYPFGLLVNFNVSSLRHGLRRLTLRAHNNYSS